MKIVKNILIISLAFFAAIIVTCLAFYFVSTRSSRLDPKKLNPSENYATVYDDENNKISDVSLTNANKKIKLTDLPDHVKFAFIASEDKRFYKHHGLDYARIAKAALKNISKMSFRQGASTISQQLIKNTHLTNEKTLTRKLREIKLTKKLEKKYSKNQILESYLNTIYFGNACYGIENASNFYFKKSASQLNEAESATLAAIIRAPALYSPFANAEKCLTTRNSILTKMRDLGYISAQSCEKAIQEPLPVKGENTIFSRSYLQCVYEELESLPIYSPYTFTKGYKIYTYMDSDLQDYTENLKTDVDRSGKSIVIINNKTHGVVACTFTQGDLKRQPGSLFKPLAVYAPALEENLISASTPVADVKTDFGGYTPKNYKEQYRGYVSCREALKDSLNVPAVSILEKLGISKSEKFLKKMQLDITKKDKNLSLALGGTNEGFSLKNLTGAYSVFANKGRYAPSAYIRKITDENGNTVYEHNVIPTRVFSEDTAYIISDILHDATQNGTAKKLSFLPFYVCAKTGTCGNEQGNTDAYTISFTSDYSVGVWMGNADNTLTNITGGGLPCHYAMLLNKKIASRGAPQPIQGQESVEEISLDKITYEKDHTLNLADKNQPTEYTFTEIFRKSNIPPHTCGIFDSPQIKADISCKNKQIIIDLCQTEYYEIEIKRTNNGKTITIFDGKIENEFIDKNIIEDNKYVYSITPYFYNDTGEKISGKTITLPAVKVSEKKSEHTKPNIGFDWWKA